ncbi:hypothetical protein RV134_310163 [Roseovarius sp. EC-HK134]|nr:hypothetical protein RV134_310163 [Roseovarius sp. EC-HK134]
MINCRAIKPACMVQSLMKAIYNFATRHLFLLLRLHLLSNISSGDLRQILLSSARPFFYDLINHLADHPFLSCC